LVFAFGEANETENWFYKCRDAGLIGRERAEEWLRTVRDIQKMLGSPKASIAVREIEETHGITEQGGP